MTCMPENIEEMFYMHMADALISPVVGGVFWAASTYLTAKSSTALKKMRRTARQP